MAGVSRDCNHEEVGSSQRRQTCRSCRRSRGGRDSLKNENVLENMSWDCFWDCLKIENVLQDNLYMVFELLERGEVLEIPAEKPLTEEEAWWDKYLSVHLSFSLSSSPSNLPSILLCPCLKYFRPERQMFYISTVYKEIQTCESSDCEGEERFYAQAITIYSLRWKYSIKLLPKKPSWSLCPL